MNFWLFKTEPSTYSWNDLKKENNKTAFWDGVRNYQARNFLRDQIKRGDLVFIYHSVVKPQAIAGIAKVVSESKPDSTAFDSSSQYFDPKSSLNNPRWFGVDIRAIKEFDPPITRDELKNLSGLRDMTLLQKGSRLSVQPVEPKEWEIILQYRTPIDI